LWAFQTKTILLQTLSAGTNANSLWSLSISFITSGLVNTEWQMECTLVLMFRIRDFNIHLIPLTVMIISSEMIFIIFSANFLSHFLLWDRSYAFNTQSGTVWFTIYTQWHAWHIYGVRLRSWEELKIHLQKGFHVFEHCRSPSGYSKHTVTPILVGNFHVAPRS
jgi:hypothetical protein